MEGKDLDYAKDTDGDAVECYDCTCQGVTQYFGFCASCWAGLTPQQRAALRGEEPPVKEIIEYRTVITKKEDGHAALVFLWLVTMTALLLVVWKLAK